MAINVDVLGNTQPLEAAVQSAVNRIRRRPIKITVDDKGATQPLGNMRRSADEFSKSMEAANARIIAFGASMAIINGVADAFKGMVRNVVEVEKALADINVVMGLSAQNLERFSDGLFTVAKETGQAFKIAADAATEYARQGLSMEESLKRTKDALILTRLTGMDSANAVKSLTAAMNTYGNQIKDTTQLVSKFAAVDVKFAVSAEDFADAIARTGAAARGAGVDIDELIGLVTAAQQQTARGGKVIGNSFKTIFTRIGRTDTLNQLENLGIAVRDIEGNTLGAKRILTDLANTFDRLTEAQKAQIAQTVGGVFQINVLKAVLGDAAKQNGILANATQISAGATDEAITKNEQLRQTMAAMATETGLAIKEVSAKIGEIALAPGMEKILNVVKSVAEGANNLLGDGESAGNKFANGFLKGLGNIITGPGLVVIVAVFGKLFLKAAQYARESLASLIGVTTEAQKQKAIQTSLVNLFGQNAALSKEMLRTDISRTEKEKIILALLKAQVAEANVLNAVSKQAASTLYRQGFGANLAPRRGRADGHVPNFAEREQAAKGGYAAGNIREMSMPGQGSVIYNSAEKVKNFAGMKQPAIMPPLSSKAGKNYQQAFGDVHGFDPYAGSGYVPNFSKGRKHKHHTKKGKKGMFSFDGAIDLTRKAQNLGILFGYGPQNVMRENYSQKFNTMGGREYSRSTGHNASSASTLTRMLEANYKIHSNFTNTFGQKQTERLEKFYEHLRGKNPSVSVKMDSKAISPVSAENVITAKEMDKLGADKLKKIMRKPLDGAMEKIATDIGDPFLKGADGLKLGGIFSKNSQNTKANDVIGALAEMAVRGALDAVAGQAEEGGKAGAPFDFTGAHAKKISEFFDNGKFYKAIEMKLRGSTAQGADGGIPNKVIRRIGPKLGAAATGYIPNFSLMSPEEREALQIANTKDAKKRIKKFGNSNFSIGDGFYNDSPLIRVTDPKTGTATDFAYAKEYGERTPQTSIIYSSRAKGVGVNDPNAKGGAFRNFGLITDFTSKQGRNKSINSDFDQVRGAAGKTPWAMMLNAFPQLKQRIRPGMQTSGTFGIGMDEIDFNSLKSLKKKTNLWVKGNGLESFIGYATANLGLNKTTGMIGGTSSGEYFSLSGLRSAILNRKDKRYLHDSKVGFKAGGYIPNFADPLSDAIGREKGAGVPVSQIRVGSHQALMNKGNPLGLGVTNTTDEPNGLRDVFGANGYVPNYAFTEDDFKNANRMPGAPSIKRADGQFAKLADVADEANKELKELTKEFKEGKINKDKFNKRIKDISNKYNLNSATTERVTKAQYKSIGAIGRLDAARNRASLSFQQSPMGRATGKMGKMFGGNAGMMMMMGAPMAAGFLQSDGPGQGGTAYAAGGALTGAASGGMMAAMVAPMFGPAAPLVIGVGALLGGVKGLIGANEENTKALKERQEKDAQQLAGVFGSIPINLSQEQIDKVNEVVETTVGQYQNERRFGRQNRELDQSNNRRNAKARKAAILESLKKVNIDEQFAINAPQFVDGAMKRDKDKNIVMSAQKMGRDQMRQMVEKMPINDKGVQDALEEYYNKLKETNVETSVAQSKETKAIILRLNLQKAITLAQQEAKVAQIDIKQKYFEQANMLDAQTKILGGLISEEQKARLSYNKSLLKNAETRAAGERAAEDAMQLGILQDIKGSKAAGLEQELKGVLFKQDKRELQDIPFKDLTDKLGEKSAQELLKILLDISKTNGDAKEIAEQRTAQLRSQISVLDKQKTLSDNIASAEYKTNGAISERKDLMKDVNLEMQKYIMGLDYATQERNIGLEVQTARFKAGPVRSQQEIFRFEQEQVAARQQNLRDEYTKSAITDMNKFADELGLTEQQRLAVAADPNKLNTMSSEAINSMEKEFKSKGGSREITKLDNLIKHSSTVTNKTKDQLKLESDKKNKLNELKTLEQSIANAKSQSLKQESEVIQKLQDQLNITNKKINKEAELQAIKEKEYLRKTGPGAAMEGFSDGMTDMRKKIAMMDYELTKSIPDKLASGLATAMTEAVNGAKNIGDALEDAALNFLSYMQQAMMQKLAMQAVGALGFSQGGGVRKYSSGGNVPAMVTNGEYVMGREAVKKYGGGFMHSLNARGKIPNYSMGGDTMQEYGMGKIPKYTMGGDTMQEYGMGKIPYMSRGGEPGSALAANFGGGESFVSGRNYQSRAMSGFFYSGQAGNVGLQEDTQEFKGILQKREEERRRREMERQAKKAKRRKILGMIGSIATSYVLGNIFSGASSSGIGGTPESLAIPSGSKIEGSFLKDALAPRNSSAIAGGYNFTTGMFPQQAFGIPANSQIEGSFIQDSFNSRNYLRRAHGGMIHGKSGIDQIPAMLSEGEYVIKASSARQMGKPMLDRINAGKFYEGGSVSPEAQKEESSVSGGQTNNISINIKMDGSGNKQESSENQQDSDGDVKKQNQSELGKKIKDAVVGVIIEEKRPGGLLSEVQ